MKRKNKSLFTEIDFKGIFHNLSPIIFLMTAGILIVIAQWAVLSGRGDSFKIGLPAPETYRAISPMRYDDYESAETLRHMVAESIEGVVVRDMAAKNRLRRRLEIIRDLKDTQSAKNSPYLLSFPDPLLSAILRLSSEDKSRILNYSYQVGSSYIDRVNAEKLYRYDDNSLISILWNEINKSDASANDANFIYQILSGMGNIIFREDESLTELAKHAAINDVPAIDRRLEQGDVIVAMGEIVTKQTALLLRLQGYTEDIFPLYEIFAVIVFVVALPLWLGILKLGAGEHKPSSWCVVFIMITAWIFETLAAKFGIAGAGALAAVTVSYLCVQDYYYAFCVAVMSSASGVFIITGQSVTNVILLASLSVFASTLGFYLLRNVETNRQLWRRVILSSFILTIVRILMRCIQGYEFTQESFRLFIPLGEFWQEAFLFMIADTSFAILMTLIFPFFEEYLDALSIMTIRDVSNPSSPLLRDLQRQAPGTYQHSLTIATLIEAVGIELGMDVNLLRAGAYYHDIGKLRKPEYFVENQGGGVNIHDRLSPMLSSMAIISHVKDGLELAWQAKLPKRICDFIAEHHGDTSTRYFYNKAVAMGEKVEWSQFCYPGPKPQSRETALLMITDSVEAAVRAANIRELEAVDKIEKIVNQVVQSKINENQFDNVSFTLKDLTIIKQTLTSVLMSMYHTRKVKKIERKK